MATIAVMITNLFEDVEYTRPAEAFKAAGHRLVHLSTQPEGSVVKGKKEQTPVKIDQSVKGAKVDAFDALFIPGGYSPDQLRVDPKAVEFAREFVRSGKPVLSICHAPQLLITADVVRQRKITGYTSIIQDLKNAGAEFIDKEVVVDRNLVSSRNPNDIPAFIDASLKTIGHA